MFDLHVHAAPDITERHGDDHAVVASYLAAGFSGCVLKAHYESTVGRAVAASRGHSPGPLGLMESQGSFDVYGGIALNQHVGGVNPAAVAACLEAGGRLVWMPTADARLQRTAGLPSLCGVRPELPGKAYAIPPLAPEAADDVALVCQMVADADAVLATGHLSVREVCWLLKTARRYGVRRLLLTHPGYTVPHMSAAEAAELAERYGALVEITTYQLLHQPGMTAAQLAAYASRVGLHRIVLASDAGQPDSPSPPEALWHLVEVLLRQGLDRQALLDCAGEIPRALVTPL